MGLGSNYGMRGGYGPGDAKKGKNNGAWNTRMDVHPNPNYFAERHRAAAKEAFRTFRPALLRVAEILAKHIRLTIMARGANVGQPWDPLDETYRKAKERSVGTKADGRYTNMLLNELTDADKGIKHIGSHSMEYGSSQGVRSVLWNFGAGAITRGVKAHNVSNPGGNWFKRKSYTTKAYKYGRRATLWWTPTLREQCMLELHQFAVEKIRAAGLPIT